MKTTITSDIQLVSEQGNADKYDEELRRQQKDGLDEDFVDYEYFLCTKERKYGIFKQKGKEKFR